MGQLLPHLPHFCLCLSIDSTFKKKKSGLITLFSLVPFQWAGWKVGVDIVWLFVRCDTSQMFNLATLLCICNASTNNSLSGRTANTKIFRIIHNLWWPCQNVRHERHFLYELSTCFHGHTHYLSRAVSYRCLCHFCTVSTRDFTHRFKA